MRAAISLKWIQTSLSNTSRILQMKNSLIWQIGQQRFVLSAQRSKYKGKSLKSR